MPIVHLEQDGRETEVEVPADAIELGEDEDLDNEDLPDGLVTQETINEAIGNRLPRAYEQTLEAAGLDPDDYKDEDGTYDLDALEEDDVFEKLAEDRGIELREDGRPKGSLKDEEIQDLQEKARKYEDVKDELEELRETDRQRRLDEAWEKVKEELPPVRDGAEELLRQRFEEDVEITDDGVVPVDEDGEILKDEVHAPQDVSVLAEKLPAEYDFAFESTEMNGGPEDDPGSPSPSGETLTRDQYRKEVEKARQENDMERMDELAEMEANDQIID